jgi:FixJ family two-component response regulator
MIALGVPDTERGDYFLLVADVRMPGMNGYSLAREAKRLNPDVSVILISGFDIEGSIEGVPVGAIDEFVEKPVSMATLMFTVNKYIESQAIRTKAIRKTIEYDETLRGKLNGLRQKEFRCFPIVGTLEEVSAPSARKVLPGLFAVLLRRPASQLVVVAIPGVRYW